MSPSVEAFDEAKYQALMDGLDFQEIHKNALENEFTIGAEYYGKEYVAAANAVKKCSRTMPLGTMWELATDGDHGSPDYQDHGVLYLLSECVKDGYIEKTKCRYVTVEKNQELRRSCLHPGDIVVTKTGVYFGKSAVIPESIAEANTIAHVGKITLKPQYNPYFVSTFLNCKYGYYQLRRRGIKATRPEIKLVEFPDIIVPEFSTTLSAAVEFTVRKANMLLDASNETYSKASQQLMDALDMNSMCIEENAPKLVSFSDSFLSTGRLDAEYYQPKFDMYLASLNKFETTHIPDEFDVYKNSGTNYADNINEVGVIKTKQLTNSGIDVDGVESFFALKTCVENKSTFIASNDVIFASMGVGSLGKVSLFSYDGDKAFVTDSTLRIYRAKATGRILPEVLCIFLQSTVGQELIYRYVVGSTGIINIYDDDMTKIPIPIIDEEGQRSIAAQVQNTFELRRQAKQLLKCAKQAVEMAIEQNEGTALAWLGDKVPDLEV